MKKGWEIIVGGDEWKIKCTCGRVARMAIGDNNGDSHAIIYLCPICWGSFLTHMKGR